MRLGRALIVAATLLAGCGFDAPDATSATEAAVAIETQGCQPVQVGSGAVVGDGVVLTAAHVVAGARIVEVIDRDGRRHTAVPVVLDTDRDVAVLRAEGLGPDRIRLAERRVRTTSAIALPGRLLAAPLRRTVWANTTDIHRRRDVTRLMLELDLAATPGESGAAVLDGTGRLAGVLVSVARDLDISYAVHVEELAPLLEDVPSVPVDPGSCAR